MSGRKINGSCKYGCRDICKRSGNNCTDLDSFRVISKKTVCKKSVEISDIYYNCNGNPNGHFRYLRNERKRELDAVCKYAAWISDHLYYYIADLRHYDAVFAEKEDVVIGKGRNF